METNTKIRWGQGSQTQKKKLKRKHLDLGIKKKKKKPEGQGRGGSLLSGKVIVRKGTLVEGVGGGKDRYINFKK